MTLPELCKLVIYYCDELGEAYGMEVISFEELPEYLAEALDLYDFRMSEYIAAPDTWPYEDYPECICGEEVFGEPHFVLQWGPADEDPDGDDWAEWQLALHEECMFEFFEEITGGIAFETEEDYLMWRDDPDGCYHL